LFSVFLCLGLSLAVSGARAEPGEGEQHAQVLVRIDSGAAWRRLVDYEIWEKRGELMHAARNSLTFLKSDKAHSVYERFSSAGIARQRVIRSLRRFQFVMQHTDSAEELYSKLLREFDVFRSVGRDGRGTVRFTAYFQPTYKASRVRTDEYRYPIYKLPSDFSSWPKPHPKRVELEGYEGMGNAEGRLEGLELAWLKSRYEAFMIHVQGSALLDLPDGKRMSVGYAGNSDYAFVGFTAACLQNKPRNLAAHDFFARNPAELNRCLARNNRFIFFEEKPSTDPIGSLGVPVTAGCSIATDKRLMPPGAFGLIRTRMPYRRKDGSLELRMTSRIVLDQDSGGAIKGPGRADIFMGSGPEAGKQARAVYADGELFYFFLKDEKQSA